MLNQIRLNHNLRKHFLINSLIVLIIILPSIRLAFFSYENLLKGYADQEYFNYRDINTKIEVIDLGECFPELKRLLGPANICSLKSRLDKLAKLNKQIKILNLTQLGFLDNQKYYEKDSPFPLWMKNGVTISKSLEIELISKVQSSYYDLVLIESVDKGISSHAFRNNLKRIADDNKEFELIVSDSYSPTCLKKKPISNCGIYMYYGILILIWIKIFLKL